MLTKMTRKVADPSSRKNCFAVMKKSRPGPTLSKTRLGLLKDIKAQTTARTAIAAFAQSKVPDARQNRKLRHASSAFEGGLATPPHIPS